MKLSRYVQIPFEKTAEMQGLEIVIAEKKARVEAVRAAHQTRLWQLDAKHQQKVETLESRRQRLLALRGHTPEPIKAKIEAAYHKVKAKIDEPYKQTRFDWGGQQLSAILEASPRKEIVELRRLEYAARKANPTPSTYPLPGEGEREGGDQPAITIILPGERGSYEDAQRDQMAADLFASEKARLDAELMQTARQTYVMLGGTQ